MRTLSLLILAIATAGCSARGIYPSLAPRATEGIDPRVPINPVPSTGTLDPRTSAALSQAVSAARGGVAEFNRLASAAEALAARAGPRQSESWIAAQQALSALGAQHGVTTNAAATVDALAAEAIAQRRWLTPATQTAIEGAALEVGAINDAQSALIDQIGKRLGN